MIETLSSIAQALSKLRTDDPPVPKVRRNEVVEELRILNHDTVIRSLSAALSDENSEFRCSVAWVFVAFDAVEAMIELRSLLPSEPDSGVRGYYCELIVNTLRHEAIPTLTERLENDPDGANRVWAASALGSLGDASALPALRRVLTRDDGVDHEGRTVREVAADAIRRIAQRKTTASVA